MKMATEQTYKELTKLSLEIIELQVNENDKRYRELNNYLVAVDISKGMIMDKLINKRY